MGNKASKTSEKDSTLSSSSEATPPSTSPSASKRRRQELETRGVLVPPKFGVAAPSTSPAMRDRLPTEPSLWALLHQTDTSYCILNDYMYPGLYVAGQEDDLGRFRFAFTDQSSPLSPSSSSLPIKYTGRVFFERLGYRSLLQLRFGTTHVPNMSAGLHVLPGCALFGHLTTTGHTWAGALIDQTFRVPTSLFERESDTTSSLSRSSTSFDGTPRSRSVNIKLGTWLDGRVKFIEQTPFKDSIYASAKEVNGYAAISFLGALFAVETKVPLNTLDWSTKSYVSMDVGGNESSTLPMRVTMERLSASNSSSMTTSTLSLSQLISFDRYQLNPVEDRAPRVLNRLGWTVRVDHQEEANVRSSSASSISTSSTEGDDDTFVGAGNTSVAFGGAWQLNSALAVKAVLRPTDFDRFLTTALIVKRWQQPRITASFLFRHSALEPITAPPRFLGVGLELETGSLPRAESFLQQDENYVGNKKKGGPVTRAVFEDEL